MYLLPFAVSDAAIGICRHMTDSEIRLLQKVQSLALDIERSSQDAAFSEPHLAQLSALLHQFQFSQEEPLQKLSLIPDHLHPQMSLQHFLNFMVPIERLIDRNLRDDHFLITTQDKSEKPVPSRPLYFVLDNLRSAFNVGSIFRLGECVGVQCIYLGGYTPNTENPSLQKTSMSTTQFVNSKAFSKTTQALLELKKQGVKIIALETSSTAVGLYEKPLVGPTAFVVGNERFGLDTSLLQLCDEIRKIPMFGIKNSLNVSNALTAAAFEWSRQNE